MRLLHASIRYLIQHHDPTWKAEYGLPVNQEDMVGTLLSFSSLIIDGLFGSYAETIRSALYPATASRAEADLPISLSLDAGGRAVGTRGFELWLGARFSQVFMTLTSGSVWWLSR